MIEAHEDKDRDWRHAYQVAIRDRASWLKEQRKNDGNRLSDRQIDRLATAYGERVVDKAINMEQEKRRFASLPRRKPERDPDAPKEDITVLPTINSKADLMDDGVIEQIDDY